MCWWSVRWYVVLLRTTDRRCGAAPVHEEQMCSGAPRDASYNQDCSPKCCVKAALWPCRLSSDEVQATALLCQSGHPRPVQDGCRAGGKCKCCKCGGGISTATLVPPRVIDGCQTYCWCAGQSCWGATLLPARYPLVPPDTWTPKAIPFKVIHPVTLQSWLLSGMIRSEVAWGQTLLGAGFAASAISATTL